MYLDFAVIAQKAHHVVARYGAAAVGYAEVALAVGGAQLVDFFSIYRLGGSLCALACAGHYFFSYCQEF